MEQKIKEAWASLHDFILGLEIEDNERQDGQAKSQEDKDAEVYKYNAESPFRLTDASVNLCVDSVYEVRVAWHAKSQMGEEIPVKVELYDYLYDSLATAGEWTSLTFPKPPSFLDNFMRKGSLTLIHAPSGVGKTPFAMLMCEAMLSGRKFLGWNMGEEKASKILYCDGELPPWLLLDRVRSCFDPTQLDNIILYSDARNYDEGKPTINLTTPAGQDKVLALARKIKPDVIVFDNRTDFWHGKESDNDEAGSLNVFLKHLRGQGIAVIMNHHSGKSGDYRGASAIIGPIDNVFGIKEKEDCEGILTATKEKNRFGKPDSGVTSYDYEPFYTPIRSYFKLC